MTCVESGQSISYRDLESRSRMLANVLLDWGLEPGDRIALFMENCPDYMTVIWSGIMIGLRVVPVNRYLKSDELAYILEDSGSSVLFVSAKLETQASRLNRDSRSKLKRFVAVDGTIEGFQSLDGLLTHASGQPVPDLPLGGTMAYTSGSTGRPKGAVLPTENRLYSEGLGQMAEWMGPMLSFNPGDRFFVAAPLYHTAPLSIAVSTLACGGTLVLMEKFDPAATLQAIDSYGVTHAYLVPTMFVRILKLPEAQRARFDVSRIRAVLHTGESCPVPLKQQMIDWWGPVFIEMYGGSELAQGTMITSQEWLEKPGSVGRGYGCTVHILDHNGDELASGLSGGVFFEAENTEGAYYHNDPEKTRSARSSHGWVSMGDLGYVDEDGYLFLVGRKQNMVVSGGVNIYPKETEDLLLQHDSVLDVVCFGLPDSDMGERLVAVVELRPDSADEQLIANELTEYCRGSIATYKCPKNFYFEETLPRLPTGKIRLHEIRDKYLKVAGA